MRGELFRLQWAGLFKFTEEGKSETRVGNNSSRNWGGLFGYEGDHFL
jgi:hypothetical protein